MSYVIFQFKMKLMNMFFNDCIWSFPSVVPERNPSIITRVIDGFLTAK